MLKRITCSILVVIFLTSVFVAASPLSVSIANAENFRKGYSLDPVNSDSTGVKPDSKYILKAQVTTKPEELQESFSIDGEPEPIIEEKSSNTFLITPSRAFEQNKLYTFRLKNGNTDITWTFQTSAVFKISGVFPSDKSANVPVNSGIEIYFSHEDYEDIDKYFEISPSTPGTFERHKKAAVFVPKKLEEGTLYTVTVKKGLKLKGTDYSLKEDYVFMFETSKTPVDNEDNLYYKGYFTYNKHLNEFKTGEKPYIPIDYYINKERVKENTVKVKTAVYSYGNVDSFIEILMKKSTIPMWAYLNYYSNFMDSEGLAKAQDFEQELGVENNGPQFIKLPESLPAGYYLVDSIWEGIRFQTFIEVTDIGMYIAKSNNKTIVWLNDLATKKPVEDASLSLIGYNIKHTTDSNGVAFFPTPAAAISVSEDNSLESKKYLKITAKDGKTAVLDYNSYIYRYYGGYGTNMYWNYLQMDRSLFKPDDTVSFWGFIKNRYENEKIDSITIEISQGYWYFHHNKVGMKGFHYPGNPQTLISQKVDVKNGIFDSTLELPNLEPGSYRLIAKKGDEIITSTYLSVENYVKPPYKIEIIKNKEAVFTGEQVEFKVKASFFEGTSVPNLNVNYNIHNGFGGRSISETKTTDSKGNLVLKYKPSAEENFQGENHSALHVNASLPEIGEISESNTVRVFINDIIVNIATDIKKDTKTISAAVSKIVLDRLNNGTAKDSGDYLGNPVGGKMLEGTLYKNTWVKIEDGQYYDFINKVTQKSYRYETRMEAVKNFTMTTDSQGKASFSINLPDFEDGWYSASIRCNDNSGRKMEFNHIYIGKYYEYNRYYNNYYEDNSYHLEGGKDSYKLDETVSLTFSKGKSPIQVSAPQVQNSFMFIKSQNGIRDYSLTNTAIHSFKLAEKDIPNTYVLGVYFNGITYVESEFYNCVFDYKEKELEISAQMDKSSYKPGEEVRIKINAKNKSGVPQKAVINASIVDEALLKLQDHEANTLDRIYACVPSGINYTYQSHLNSGMEESSRGYESKGIDSATMSVEKEDGGLRNVKAKSYLNNESAKLREDFRDTAFFSTIILNEKGTGELKFKLPDNITSWRVTLAGVTPNLMSGSNRVELKVSLPFFINYTMNSTYLAGDTPVIGVNAYGNDLKDSDTIFFEVSSSSNPKVKLKAHGKAFERVNIPLWKLTEGNNDIFITAFTANGLKDSIKQKLTVLNSYHQIDRAVYYKLSKNTALKGGNSGNTKLVFTDGTKGAYLPVLTNMLYTGGNRIDQKLAAKMSAELIKTHFKNEEILYSGQSFKASDYQTQDGGIALLPYGSSDIDLSAKLTPLVSKEINIPRLKEYFYNTLYSDSPGLKGNALYGLSALGEPVLLDLDKAAKVENANIKDILYIALAYCELGETSKADRLFTDSISKYIEEYRPYYRLNTGIDRDDTLECTSLASQLASKLNKPEKKGLYEYCLANSTKDILINLEKLTYIAQEIGKATEDTAKFTYTLYGKKHTRALKNGEVFTLNIPSRKISELKISSVSGSISVISVFKEQTTLPAKLDPNISVSRKYFSYANPTKQTTTFKENDIVKVVLDWNIGAKAIEGGYEITDYLPSGLKPVAIPSSLGAIYDKHCSYGNIDGQKVSFYVYSEWPKDSHKLPLYYYARVVSPGTYKADGTVIQGISSRDSINVGKTEIITIR
ncbi:MAG: Ig-like domain-containing protein [Clostridia bacterium]|nr:Ig-like domain-containing protein [Clostridia bacterium]